MEALANTSSTTIQDDPRPFKAPIPPGCIQIGVDDLMVCDHDYYNTGDPDRVDGCGGYYYQRCYTTPDRLVVTERTACQCVAEIKAQQDRAWQFDQVKTRRINLINKAEQYFGGYDLLTDASYIRTSLQNYIPRTPSQIEAYTQVKDFVPGRDSICFYGAAGRGKTHLALCIARAAKDNGVPVLALRVIDLLTRLKRTYDRKDDVAELDIMRLLKDIDLLLIDDIGVEKTTDWVKSKFYEIIDYRHNRKSTIYTTNLAGQEMHDKEGQPLVSRIWGSKYKFEIEGPDHRISKLT